MGINWVTFIAQLVNLFVLVWLLKRFLYQPILNAVDKRQAEIQDKVNRAAQEYESAKADHAALEQQRRDFEAERQRLFDNAGQEIAVLKQEQMAELNTLKEKMRQKIQSDLERDKQQTSLKIRNTAAQHFMAIAERMIENFGSISPNEQAVELFKKQLDMLTKEQTETLRPIAEERGFITLYQSEKISPVRQKRLNSFILEKLQLPEWVDVVPEINENLILGFELHIGDTVIEWSLKAFAEELRANMDNALSDIGLTK